MPNKPDRIEVLGPGCPRCLETMRAVRQAVEQAGLEVSVEKVDSLHRMTELGVLRTPAIAVDGRIVLSGRVPRPEDVLDLLGLR